MKKQLVAVAMGLMMLAPVAQAERGQRHNQGQRQQQHGSYEDRREQEILSQVFGGLITLIAAEALDNGRHDDRYDRRDRRNDGWDRGYPRDDGYGRYPAPGRYPQPRVVFCFAESRRGETFRARGQSAQIAQAKALNKCYQSARMCRPVGCQY